MRDPRDYTVELEDGMYVTDCPEIEWRTFITAEDCFRAIEEACLDANIMAAELQGDLSYAEERIAMGTK